MLISSPESAELILSSLMEITHSSDEASAARMYVACFLNLSSTLKRAIPTTAASIMLLKAMNATVRCPEAKDMIKNNILVQKELGHFFQSIFASRDDTYPEAKALALNMLDHIFVSGSESGLTPFIDDFFIGEWLVESVRNAGAFSTLALGSLAKHFFTNHRFMKHEFSIGEGSI